MRKRFVISSAFLFPMSASIFITIAIGTAYILHAQSVPASVRFEAETGVITPPTQVLSDSTASGGAYMRFNSGSTVMNPLYAQTLGDSVGVSNAGKLNEYEIWLNRNVRYRGTYFKYLLRNDTTAVALSRMKETFTGNSGHFYSIKTVNESRKNSGKPDMTVVDTIGMVPDDLENAQKDCTYQGETMKCNIANLKRGMAGEWDPFYKAIAEEIVQEGLNCNFVDGRPKLILRFGHESNGNWYGWSSFGGDEAEQLFINLWRRAHGIMKTVFVADSNCGNKVQWDWNIAAGNTFNETQMRDTYPGNEYVDIIGIDFYDREHTGVNNRYFQCPLPTCPPFPVPSRTLDKNVEAWNKSQSKINKMLDFAVEKDKPVGISEWGVTAKNRGVLGWEGGGNNPYFIEKVHEWASSITQSGSAPAARKRLSYLIYFERQDEFSKEDGIGVSRQKLSPGDDSSEVPNVKGVLEFDYGKGLESTAFPNTGNTKGAAARYLELFGNP